VLRSFFFVLVLPGSPLTWRLNQPQQGSEATLAFNFFRNMLSFTTPFWLFDFIAKSDSGVAVSLILLSLLKSQRITKLSLSMANSSARSQFSSLLPSSPPLAYWCGKAPLSGPRAARPTGAKQRELEEVRTKKNKPEVPVVFELESSIQLVALSEQNTIPIIIYRSVTGQHH
jgi:hypothetical protein